MPPVAPYVLNTMKKLIGAVLAISACGGSGSYPSDGVEAPVSTTPQAPAATPSLLQAPTRSPCLTWSVYPLPAGSCMYATAPRGAGLVDGPYTPGVCSTPSLTLDVLTSFTPRSWPARLVPIYCSVPGACSIRIVTADADASCASVMTDD